MRREENWSTRRKTSRQEQTTNSSHIDTKSGNRTLLIGHIGERRVLSPLHYAISASRVKCKKMQTNRLTINFEFSFGVKCLQQRKENKGNRWFYFSKTPQGRPKVLVMKSQLSLSQWSRVSKVIRVCCMLRFWFITLCDWLTTLCFTYIYCDWPQ